MPSSKDTIVAKTLGEEEQALWNYFRDFEKQLENDSKIKKEKIPKIIQTLINDGELLTPLLFIDTEQGTQRKVGDYLTYKKYRNENPIDLNRYHVLKISVSDSLASEQDSQLRQLLISDSIPK